MSNTPARAVRIPDDLWDAALARARDDGETLSEVVRRMLAKYVQYGSGVTY